MPEKQDQYPADDGTITAHEMIQLLGISEIELTKLTRESVLVRQTGKRNGRACIVFDWRVNVPRYCAHQRQPSLQVRDDWVYEKRATQQVIRAHKELELQYARGELVKRSRVLQYMVNLLTGMKNKVLGIPSRCARLLLGQTDIHKVRRILDEACRLALVDAANLSADSFDETPKNGQKGHMPQAPARRRN